MLFFYFEGLETFVECVRNRWSTTFFKKFSVKFCLEGIVL